MHNETTQTCGARKPGWEHGPAIGRHRIPCVHSAGHSGNHRDALGQTWTVQQGAETLTAVLAAVEPDVRIVAETYGGQHAGELAQELRLLVWSALSAAKA